MQSIKEQAAALIDETIAQIIIERVAKRVEEQFAEKWRTIVAELVNTRKSNQELHESAKQLLAQSEELKTLAETLQEQTQKNQELQRKQALILKVASQELGLEE